MRRLLQASEVLALGMLPVILAVCALCGAEQTALLTMLAACVSVVPFFLRFERQKPRPRDIMPLVVLAAIAAAGRILFAPFPNFKPVTAIVIIGGVCFGPQAGFLTGALAALSSNMYFGQGPWTPWQMYAWGLIGFLAGLLGRREVTGKPLVIYIFGFLSAFLYSAVMDSWTVIGFVAPVTWEAIVTGYAAGLPFTLSHGIATVVFLLPTYTVWRRKIRRVQMKYGI